MLKFQKCTLFLCYNNVPPLFVAHKQRLIFSSKTEVNQHIIAAHNFSKINLLKAYSTGIVCLSGTYVDSPFLVNDENFIQG